MENQNLDRTYISSYTTPYRSSLPSEQIFSTNLRLSKAPIRALLVVETRPLLLQRITSICITCVL
jgi:hypothetical protein